MDENIQPIMSYSQKKRPSLQDEIAAAEALSSICGLPSMTAAEKERFIETRQRVAEDDSKREKRVTLIVTLVFWAFVIAMGIFLPYSVPSEVPRPSAVLWWGGLSCVMIPCWLFSVSICRKIM